MMPPAGMPRPDEATYDAFARDLESSLDRAPRHDIRIPAGPIRSAGSTAPNIRTRSATSSLSTSMSPRCSPKTMRAMASTTWRTANCRRRCWSATWPRRRRSAAAVGGPLPSPASHVVVLPSDLTQEDHLDGLPFGTRGGTLVPLHFPARRRIRDPDSAVARPQRERRRTHRAAAVELTLDGQRVQLFTVKPNRNQSGDLLRRRSRRQGPEGPDSGGRGPARGRRHCSRERRSRCEKRSASRTRRTSTWTGIRGFSPRSTRCRSPARSSAARSATRPAAALFVCRAVATPLRELKPPARRRSCRPWRAARIAGRHRRRPRGAAAVLQRGARRRRLRRRHRDGAARDARQHRVPVPHRAGSQGRCPAVALSRQRCRAGLPPVVLPVEQHSRRRTARPGDRRQAESAGDARAAGEADARRSRAERARHQLRRPVAVSAESCRRESGRADVPRLRRQPAAGLPARNGAVLRQHRAAKTAARSICCARTTRSSTSGWPSTTAFRTSTAAASGA